VGQPDRSGHRAPLTRCRGKSPKRASSSAPIRRDASSARKTCWSTRARWAGGATSIDSTL
jgi:hypothetical protein